MDKETVTNLAREAGFDISEKWQQISCDGYDYTDEMQKFAALVVSHEIEACAKYVEKIGKDYLKAGDVSGSGVCGYVSGMLRMRSNARNQQPARSDGRLQ